MVYWFLKLKNRSFRHQLVMLLVMSDSLKACSEIIYPAKTLLSDSTNSDTLCTVLGFLCNVFVEAADIAVLFIAIHTALCIFRPPTNVSSDKAGLYPYRYWVYSIWAGFGILMASLAFLNKQTAYINAVSWCFLPIRPFYWRIALSWAPRYAILLFIFIVYLAIFIYVKRKFRSFRQAFAATLEEDSSGLGTSTADHGMHYTTNAEHQIANLDMQLTNDPLRSPGLYPTCPPMSKRASSQGYRPTLVFLNSDDRFPFQLRRESILTINEKYDATKQRSESSVSGDDASAQPLSDGSVKPRPARLNLQSLGRSYTMKVPFIEYGESSSSAPTTPAPRPVDPLSAERTRIVKQLKHLFVFPIIYFLMWIVPFAFHLTQYHDKFVTSPVFVLAGCSSFMIPLHGFIDVIVYARNEKPWKSWRYRHHGRGYHHARNEKYIPQVDAQQIPVIDLVEQRRQQELIEAHEKKLKRQSMPQSASVIPNSTEWWDLEAEEHEPVSDIVLK